LAVIASEAEQSSATPRFWISSSLRPPQRWCGRPPTASVCQTG